MATTLIRMCECEDHGCPAHRGEKCGAHKTVQATTLLHRVDMDDETGVAMCDACAEDALESGVFA